MDVEFVTRKSSNNSVIWNVSVPQVNNTVLSKTFEICGSRWNLKFKKYFLNAGFQGQFEALDLSLQYNCGGTALFTLKLYIRSGGTDTYLSHKEINSQSVSVWNCRCAEFTRDHPNIPIVGTPLQFVLDFDLIVKKREIPSSLKGEKLFFQATTTEKYGCLENLSLDLSRLVEDDSEQDVLLKCGEFSMGAHKLILGARSEVFRNMMESDMVEGREGSVEISDMEPEVLEVFVRYIYTGILPELTEDTALPLYEAADKYQVEALYKRTGLFLAENVSPENVLGFLVTADAHGDTDLKRRLVSYIAEEKMLPKKKEEWLEFCNQYPKLANEVLNRYIEL